MTGACARRPDATLLPAEQPKCSHAFPSVALLIVVLIVLVLMRRRWAKIMLWRASWFRAAWFRAA